MVEVMEGDRVCKFSSASFKRRGQFFDKIEKLNNTKLHPSVIIK
jgi:hypothetical protein